jgi:hypothetical protein
MYHPVSQSHFPCIQANKTVPLVAAVIAELGDHYVDGNPFAGKVALGCSEKQSGWTFRVVAPVAVMGTVSLLNTNRRHADPVMVMSEAHYGKYRPERPEAREAYRKFLLRAGVDIGHKGSEDKVPVPVGFLLRNVAEFVRLMIAFT